MPKVSPLQSDFSGGELSPFFYGRVDSPRYKQSVAQVLNYIPMIQGPLNRRPGNMWVFNTKSNQYARLQGFEFSILQAYMIEFGNQYVRFFKNNANITLPAKTITGITQATPAVVTCPTHGFLAGDRIVIEGVLGMTQTDNVEYIVATPVLTNSFALHDVDGNAVNSTGYDAYVSGGNASKIYEVVTPYLTEDLDQLKFTQSADVLYITHPDFKPKKLLRHDHADWSIVDVDFSDGPYLTTNNEQTDMTPGAATGNGQTLVVGPDRSISGAANNGSGLIRITATAHGFLDGDKVFIKNVTGTTEANGTWTIILVDVDNFDLKGSVFANAWISGGDAFPAIFAATDIGRHIRMQEGTTWGWAKVATFTDPAHVTIDIQATLTNTNAKKNWRLGIYCDTLGWPATVTFHEDRLVFAGAAGAPQRIDGSRSGDYENMKPTEYDSSVKPDNGIGFAFNSNDVNKVIWLTSDEKGLLTGTTSGEWLTRPSSIGDALQPTNITAKKSTSWGSEDVQPVQAGKATLFIQRSGRKVREMNYYFDIDGFRSNDMTQLANHILPTGVKQMAYQKEPISVIWCVRNDGTLAGMTYDRDIDALRVGWHRHVPGGVSDAAGSPSFVESVQVLPSADGERQDTWLIVQRYINGKVVRNIEYITQLFEDFIEQKDAFFVDAGLTFDNPISITGITKASPAVVTAPAHGFSNGDKVLIMHVLGMGQVNGVTYIIKNKTTDTFELTSVDDGSNIDSVGYSTYVSDGEVRKMVSTIAGINHLEGQSVQILADGAVQPNQTVTKGKITLSIPAATIHIGLGYNSDVEFLRFEAGSSEGTALGKTRRTHRMGIVLHRSLGLKIGYGFDNLDTVTFRKTSDKLTRAPGLFSGILSENVESDYDFDNNFCMRQDQPLPSIIQAISPQMITQDRG